MHGALQYTYHILCLDFEEAIFVVSIIEINNSICTLECFDEALSGFANFLKRSNIRHCLNYLSKTHEELCIERMP